MITQEQINRLRSETAAKAANAFQAAKSAERILEDYTYYRGRDYDPEKREELWKAFNEADYQAESQAWLLNLILEKVEC